MAAATRTKDSEDSPRSDAGDITITVTHRNTPLVFTFDASATISDLSDAITEDFEIPPSHQKFLIAKHGMQKPPFKNPDLALATLQNLKIQLLASSATELSSFQDAADKARARAASRAHHRHRQSARPHRSRAPRPEDNYTFLTLRPLAGLPHPERSMALLERLRDDPGIRATMRKHQYTVGLLTEMEPLSNTQSTHEGTTRLLGLNRNKGQAIELRLRTDAHDGYRDYKTIRKTLCHELAHNIHSDHDRNFWDLCHQIEREVDQLGSGHSLADGGGTYAPARDDEEDYPQDHGGWEGGEFVLGGGSMLTSGLSRSEILAKAASDRLRRQNMETRDGDEPDKKSPGPSSIP
ncbi:WLM domain-containing protein [Plectosphaerella plurivora]|uniref:WLM domain-containing protein n=1 Tax=Plectosphaerella plurivora TaxID=936078 RepID=A0A9P8V8P1_9PEZI|nr:WLM domain-containing protein [Plectosphaerella plurivora]